MVEVKEAVEEEAMTEVEAEVDMTKMAMEVKMEMVGKIEKEVLILVICALESSDI